MFNKINLDSERLNDHVIFQMNNPSYVCLKVHISYMTYHYQIGTDLEAEEHELGEEKK